MHSNEPSGYGRYDIAIEPHNPAGTGFIMELKVAKTEEEMDAKLDEAKDQIAAKEYSAKMQERGVAEIVEMGIVFCGKKVKVRVIGM